MILLAVFQELSQDYEFLLGLRDLGAVAVGQTDEFILEVITLPVFF